MFTLGILCKSNKPTTPCVLFGLAIGLTQHYGLEFFAFDDAKTWLECRLIIIPNAGAYFGLALLGYGISISLARYDIEDDAKLENLDEEL